MKPARTLVTAEAAKLLGYDDPGSLPESTGTDKLVLKRGNLFAVAGRLGDIWPPGARDQGAYFEDTRFLSKLRLTVAGGPPVVLSTQTRPEYISQVDLTVTSWHFGGVFQDPVNFLHLRREQLIDEHFIERLTLTNYLVRDIDYWDSRGALWPWCVALGGQEFYNQVVAQAEIYRQAPPAGDEQT